MKLDLDFKEEKIGALNKELEELQVGGGASEEEVSTLKRQKHDLDMRLKDQVNFCVDLLLVHVLHEVLLNSMIINKYLILCS